MFKCNYDLKTLTKERIVEIYDKSTTADNDDIIAEYETEDKEMLVLFRMDGDWSTGTWLKFQILEKYKEFSYIERIDYLYEDLPLPDITNITEKELESLMKGFVANVEV